MLTVWKLRELIGGRIIAIRAQGDPPAAPVGPVETDSRLVEPGDVFWALRGARRDGNDFAAEALTRGAAGVVVSRPIQVPEGHWALVVDDTLQALWRLAAWKRRRFTGTVIGVTGSVGKTTTREMIHAVLRTRLRGTASPRNYNNHVGVPLSMLALESDHDYAVLELGASARGEIAALAGLCQPKVGVITHVGEAHLGGFGSVAEVASSKAELLAALPPDGRAVLGEDPWLECVARQCEAERIWVGRGAQCDLVATEVRSGGGVLSFRAAGQAFRVPVWGRHHLTSALAAAAVGRMFGLGMAEIADSLVRFDPVPMRCQVTECRGATIINDAYNASPMAMRAALELLREFDAPGRRIVVIGEMAELGAECAELHRQLGEQTITLCGADLLIACGPHAGQTVAGALSAGMPRAHAIQCPTPEHALPYLGQVVSPGDVVLVKGSRIMAMERIVAALATFPRRRSA